MKTKTAKVKDKFAKANATATAKINTVEMVRWSREIGPMERTIISRADLPDLRQSFTELERLRSGCFYAMQVKFMVGKMFTWTLPGRTHLQTQFHAACLTFNQVSRSDVLRGIV